MNEQKKKRDLKTILKQFLTGAVVVAVTFSLAGCVFNEFDAFNIGGNDYSISDNYEDNQHKDDENYDEYDEYVGPSYNAYLYTTGSLNEAIGMDSFGFTTSEDTNNADRRLQQGNFVPVNLVLSNENYNEFVRIVDSKDVTYIYADLYNVENAYQNIQGYQSIINNQKNQHTDLITSISKIPTEDMIYNKLVSNSNKFISSHKGYYKLDDSYMRLIAKILTNMVKENYSNLAKEDISRIYCMLNDVTAVGIDSTDFTVNELKETYNARVTDEAVVMLDTQMIKQLSGDQALEKTIAHEVAHLFQRMCPDHKIKGLTQIGNSQYVESFDSTGEVNSMHYLWLYEAAAELMSMNEYNSPKPLVYNNMVGYLHTLNIITLINPNYDQNSIIVSQMSNNPNKIYEVFGAKTEEEKKELMHMLYSICYIQTDRADFVTVYEKANGSIEGKEIQVKQLMKESVAQTMTKYFYKNLAERVNNGSVSLQDVYYLINVFESALNRHLIYSDEANIEYNDSAIKFYVETQNKFFELLAEDNNMTYDEIVKSFGEYALIIETDAGYQRNYSFSWLKQGEKDYIGQVLTTNIENLTYNIRDVEYLDRIMTK